MFSPAACTVVFFFILMAKYALIMFATIFHWSGITLLIKLTYFKQIWFLFLLLYIALVCSQLL